MKLLIATFLVTVTSITTLCISSYMIFLTVNDIPGIIKGEPESGWAAFFSLLLLPGLIFSAVVLKLSWKFYKRVKPTHHTS